VPEGLAVFPLQLSSFIQDQKITVWYSVPMVLALLQARGRLEERDLAALRRSDAGDSEGKSHEIIQRDWCYAKDSTGAILNPRNEPTLKIAAMRDQSKIFLDSESLPLQFSVQRMERSAQNEVVG